MKTMRHTLLKWGGLMLAKLSTLAESGVMGLAGFLADQWYSVVAPSGAPVVSRHRFPREFCAISTRLTKDAPIRSLPNGAKAWRSRLSRF